MIGQFPKAECDRISGAENEQSGDFPFMCAHFVIAYFGVPTETRMQ